MTVDPNDRTGRRTPVLINQEASEGLAHRRSEAAGELPPGVAMVRSRWLSVVQHPRPQGATIYSGRERPRAGARDIREVTWYEWILAVGS